MSAIIHTIGDGSSTLSLDPNPNTTPPDAERQFDTPFPSGPCNAATMYLVAKGGASVSIRIWMFDEGLVRWFAKGSAVGISTDQVIVIGEVPRGVRVTAQVTLNVGVTKVGIGFMGD